jgi:hypothetical protein
VGVNGGDAVAAETPEQAKDQPKIEAPPTPVHFDPTTRLLDKRRESAGFIKTVHQRLNVTEHV